MASKKEIVDFILEQLQDLTDVFARKMFGEYSLYYRGKVVALISDDQLFVKSSEAGKAFIGEPEYAAPYPGAIEYFRISEDNWDDAEWLCELLRISEPELKAPVQKKPKVG